jgi:hypothetical protein
LLLLVLAKRRNNSVKTNGNCSRIPKRSKWWSYKIKQTWSGTNFAESNKGSYVSGNNTKEVVEYIKKPWTLFRKPIWINTNGRFSIAVSVVYRFWFCVVVLRSFF